MSFTQAISSGFKNYVGFSGRASRSEYWFWVLFQAILVVAAGVVDAALGTKGVLQGLAGLVVLLPNIAVGIRRLHDIDRSGWWLLISLVPLIGWIVLIVWDCTKGTDGSNRFGSDPLRGMGYAAA